MPDHLINMGGTDFLFQHGQRVFVQFLTCIGQLCNERNAGGVFEPAQQRPGVLPETENPRIGSVAAVLKAADIGLLYIQNQM